MTNAHEAQTQETQSWEADKYFAAHPELFDSSVNPLKLVIAIIATLFAAGVNYVLWMEPQIVGPIDTKMWIVRALAIFGLLYCLTLFGDTKNYTDKISGGKIDTKYFNKYFTSSYQQASSDFKARKLDEILKLPAISWYYTAPTDRHQLAVAHNAEAKKFYCFLNFEDFWNSDTNDNPETIKHEPVIITDREYDRLFAMMEANKKATKAVTDAENMEKNIEVKPQI